MPTDKQLQDMLNSRGYAVRPLEMGGRPKITIWKEMKRNFDDGTSETYWAPHPNMPGDASSIKSYLAKGFELADPTSMEVDHPSIQKTKKVEPVAKQAQPKPKAKPKAQPKPKPEESDLESVIEAIKQDDTTERKDQTSSE